MENNENIFNIMVECACCGVKTTKRVNPVLNVSLCPECSKKNENSLMDQILLGRDKTKGD